MRPTTTGIAIGDATTTLHVHRWVPDSPKAVVVVAHGMAEHSYRYDRFANRLAEHGYAVYAHDHRGHGRTAGRLAEVGYFGDEAGWDTVVEDVRRVVRLATEEQGDLPVVLFGHSMGSAIARDYIGRYGDDLAGVVLSGTMADPGVLGRVGRLLATAEGKWRGRRFPSALLDKLSFGSFNKAVDSPRTDFDWLSRDPDEVDAYVADPFCGGVFSNGFYTDMLGGLGRINRPAHLARIPTALPVLLIAGAEDPVGDHGKGVTAVHDALVGAGLREVSLKLYPGARHELLNETNRDEVTDDVLGWLDRVTAGR